MNTTEQSLYLVLTLSLEPNVVDEVRTGKYRSLFHPESACFFAILVS